MSAYLSLKTLHVVVVLVWVASLAANVWLMLLFRPEAVPRSASSQTVLQSWKKLDRRVGSPAMMLVWIVGLWMVSQAGWLAFGWMRIKLALVFLLSALHGVTAGQARRMASDATYTPGPALGWVTGCGFAAVVGIVAMVVAKPLFAV